MRKPITVVDDCKELRHLIDLLVREQLGVPCLGLASLSDVKARREDVLASRAVIIDINLGPGQPDGVEVYRWIRDQAYQGQLLFLTGHAKESPQVQAAAQTGVLVLEKPMSAEQLIRYVQDYCLSEPVCVSV